MADLDRESTASPAKGRRFGVVLLGRSTFVAVEHGRGTVGIALLAVTFYFLFLLLLLSG